MAAHLSNVRVPLGNRGDVVVEWDGGSDGQLVIVLALEALCSEVQSEMQQNTGFKVGANSFELQKKSATNPRLSEISERATRATNKNHLSFFYPHALSYKGAIGVC